MSYIILTASAIESNRLQQEQWIPSAAFIPVSLLTRGVLKGAPRNADLFYTDAALDALVQSAHIEGRPWEEWRNARHLFNSVRPFEAWAYLNETSLEELAERNRPKYAVLSDVVVLDAHAKSLSYMDLVNLERRRLASSIRAFAKDHLVRVAPGRILIEEGDNSTEEDAATLLTIRASWHALPAADRTAPEWIVNGLDNQTRIGA